MGTDLIAKAADTFERKQRKCLALFEEETLFPAEPQLSIAVVATPFGGHLLSVDDERRLTLEECGRLLVVNGVTPVGVVENPPQSVVELMRGPSPSIFARIVKVFPLTGKAELQLESS